MLLSLLYPSKKYKKNEIKLISFKKTFSTST